MTFLYILLAVLALLALICTVNIKIKAEYSDDLKVKFYLGIIRIPDSLIFKGDKKRKNKKDKKKSKDTKQDDKKTLDKYLETFKKLGVYKSFSDIIDVIIPLLSTIQIYAAKIKINPLIIYIKMCDDDAATLAIDYGKFCSVFYPIINVIESNTKCNNLDTNVYVDYTSKKSELYFKTTIKFKLIYRFTLSLTLIKEIVKYKQNSDLERKYNYERKH